MHGILEQTGAEFILRKYKSVIHAALAIEGVSYLVSLTDALVAGNMINQEALIAVGLMSPFQSAALFLSAVINSGTLLNYTRCIGKFDSKRAHEAFSQGCILALALGTILAIFMLTIRSRFLNGTTVSEATRGYLEDYFNIIIWYYLLLPLFTVLDNTIMNDGGEKLSSVANIIQTVGNVLLSILLSKPLGAKGIAIASVLCQLAAMGMVCIWFMSKRSMVRFTLSFPMQNFPCLLRDGLGRSVTFAMTAIMTAIMNLYTVNRFGSDAVTVFVVVKKIMDASMIFMGLALALQPFIGTLRGEKNTKAERQLMQDACRRMLICGAVASLAALLFAPLIAAAFGIGSGALAATAIRGVRIAGSTLVVRALLMLFFVYYFLTDNRVPMFLITVLNDLAAPVTMGILGVAVFGSQEGIWAGIALAPVLSLLVCAGFVRYAYGKDRFPFLLPPRDESRIFIYDFMLNSENSAAMAETAGTVLMKYGYPAKTVRLIELLVEELLMLIHEKNGGSDRKLSAEFTIILEDVGARIILRDSGIVFDISDADANIDSFRQYIVGRALTVPNVRKHITSAGYNRNEFFFTSDRKGG